MSGLILNDTSTPATPASAKSIVYSDTADLLRRIRADGSIDLLSETGRSGQNFLDNREFQYMQRQTFAATTYNSSAARVFSADRWSHTNENASMTVQRVDTSTAGLETGLAARFYAIFTKSTNTGKIEIFQVVESVHSNHLRNRKVRFSFKARNSVGSHTLRLAVVECNNAGTADQGTGISVSAHGAAGTDPTFGASVGRLTPSACSATGTIVGNAVSCVLTSNWQQFSGVFTIPAGALNVAVIIFTDGRPTSTQAFGLSEMSLTQGEEEREYTPSDPADDRARCLRFHSNTFQLGVAEAQNAGVANGRYFSCAVTGAVARIYWSLATVPWRRVPVAGDVTTYNPAAANAQVRNTTTNTDGTGVVFLSATETGFALTITGPAGWTIGDNLNLCWSVDVEI